MSNVETSVVVPGAPHAAVVPVTESTLLGSFAATMFVLSWKSVVPTIESYGTCVPGHAPTGASLTQLWTACPYCVTAMSKNGAFVDTGHAPVPSGQSIATVTSRFGLLPDVSVL